MSSSNSNKNSLRHVAIIMDGNGRWAKKHSLPRVEGHRRGANSVKTVVEEARKKGIEYLTLFSFSTENWNRPECEVSNLMKLFAEYLESETENLRKNGIRLRAVGDLSRLAPSLQDKLSSSMEKTSGCSDLNLILAMSYGGREEIISAVKEIACKLKEGKISEEEISNAEFEKGLWTAGIPDPDVLIRTSGELRISNFLLWQLAYTEIVVRNEFWPDFGKDEFLSCLEEYYGRERRWGLSD